MCLLKLIVSGQSNQTSTLSRRLSSGHVTMKSLLRNRLLCGNLACSDLLRHIRTAQVHALNHAQYVFNEKYGVALILGHRRLQYDIQFPFLC